MSCEKKTVFSTPFLFLKKPSNKKNLEKNIPITKVGKPEDIANGIMFLLSDQSKYITGTEMIIDGGITAKP